MNKLFNIPFEHRVAPLQEEAELDKALKALVKEQLEELEEIVNVSKIILGGEDDPPRYVISFDPKVPSFRARTALEAKRWDIGTEMGSKKELRFYATKPLKRGGWKV